MFKYFLRWLYREAYFQERRKMIAARENLEHVVHRRNQSIAVMRKEIIGLHRELKDMRHAMEIIRAKELNEFWDTIERRYPDEPPSP